MNNWMSKFPRYLLLGVIALGFLVVGCSPDGFPLGPEVPKVGVELESGDTNDRGVNFSLSRLPLTKRASNSASKVKKKRIGPKGGKISITHNRTRVNFRVPSGGLESPETIRMQVIGGGPTTIVHFEPSGLYFEKPARLSVTFSSEGVNLKALGGYLIEEDGEAIPVSHKVTVHGNRVTVTILVPHFSEYSPGDGEDYEEEEEFPDDTPDDDGGEGY